MSRVVQGEFEWFLYLFRSILIQNPFSLQFGLLLPIHCQRSPSVHDAHHAHAKSHFPAGHCADLRATSATRRTLRSTE